MPKLPNLNKCRKQKTEYAHAMRLKDMADTCFRHVPRYAVINRATGQTVSRMTLEEFTDYCRGNRAALKQFVLVKGGS